MNSYKATVGAEFVSADITFEGKTVGLQIWDTAGQERFLSIGHSFYKGADCCIITFDLTDEKTFYSLDGWRNEFTECCQTRDSKRVVPFLLAGNKADRIIDRKIKADAIEHWRKSNNNIDYFEVSAKDGTNVNELFEEAGRLGYKNKIQDM